MLKDEEGKTGWGRKVDIGISETSPSKETLLYLIVMHPLAGNSLDDPDLPEPMVL